MNKGLAIAIPTRPQPDTIVAIFLLKKFGASKFPGIENAAVEIHPQLPQESFEALLQKGILALDVGGGPLDHHGKDLCTSELVARYLKVEKDPALRNLLTYARRDDKEGKGTISRDAIDRAFGLSGLISALNKVHVGEPSDVVNTVLPLLEAYYLSAREHNVELPKEVEEKKASGHYHEHEIPHGGKNVKVSAIISSKPSMPTFLRSSAGPQADVVIQKLEESNHYSVLTRQNRGIDLSIPAALIRLREGELRGIDLGSDLEVLAKQGRIDEIGMWYLDPATNSILNGGPHNREVEQSLIPWDEFKRIVLTGLGLTPASTKPSTYYLGIMIPKDAAQKLIGSMAAKKHVKVHPAENLHVTLEFFGAKSPEEAAEIAQKLQKALADKESFSIKLRNAALSHGSPEGYETSRAWYLPLGEEDGAPFVHEVRGAALEELGLPLREKELHVTVASKPRNLSVPPDALQVKEELELEIPVTELVLVESAEGEGKRVYRPHSVFKLK